MQCVVSLSHTFTHSPHRSFLRWETPPVACLQFKLPGLPKVVMNALRGTPLCGMSVYMDVYVCVGLWVCGCGWALSLLPAGLWNSKWCIGFLLKQSRCLCGSEIFEWKPSYPHLSFFDSVSLKHSVCFIRFQSLRGNLTPHLCFQVVDLYWGVDPEEWDSPELQRLRMKLLEECLKTSAGPCFVVSVKISQIRVDI